MHYFLFKTLMNVAERPLSVVMAEVVSTRRVRLCVVAPPGGLVLFVKKVSNYQFHHVVHKHNAFIDSITWSFRSEYNIWFFQHRSKHVLWILNWYD